MTKTFQFSVGPQHLKPIARNIRGIYISVDYEVGLGEINVFQYSAPAVAHESINWSSDLYSEIQDAAENNYTPSAILVSPIPEGMIAHRIDGDYDNMEHRNNYREAKEIDEMSERGEE